MPVAELQTYWQVVVDTVGHEPLPSHTAGLTWIPFEQLALRHWFAG
jgi:hypothetical protein